MLSSPSVSVMPSFLAIRFWSSWRIKFWISRPCLDRLSSLLPSTTRARLDGVSGPCRVRLGLCSSVSMFRCVRLGMRREGNVVLDSGEEEWSLWAA